MKFHLSRLWPAATLILLAACSTVPSHGYYEHDGPLGHVDLGNIHNAVPRVEPPSQFGNSPYTVFGVTYYPMKTACGYHAHGIASWYGRQFYRGRTSDGEQYNMFAMTAANKTLPLPSYVRVTNLDNGRTVIVRVNDRGPFLHNRLIDLSYAAATKLGMVASGTAPVSVVAIDTGCNDDTPLIQVGSFQLRSDADRLAWKLRQARLGPVYVVAVHVRGTKWYAVRVGPFDSLQVRGVMLERLRRQGLPTLSIITRR